MSVKRPRSILLNGNEVPIPHMVLSVSSVETNLRPDEYTSVLAASGVKTILVSAYDIYASTDRSGFSKVIQSARDKGIIVIMDSGNYEKHRYNDDEWVHDKFIEIIGETPADIYFCFDNMQPEGSSDEIAKDVINRVEHDQLLSDRNGRVQPIVHVPNNMHDQYPEICFSVAKHLEPELIAIPERRLGDGLFQRANRLSAIRHKLDELDWYQPIHLLGTGNPISMAVLSLVGGSVFDGLEWCRTSIDHVTARLHHTQQYDFFNWQSEYWNDDLDYSTKFLSHNIDFYREWNDEISKEFNPSAILIWLETKGYLSSSIINDIKLNIEYLKC